MGFAIALLVGALLGWLATLLRPPGRPRRQGLTMTAGILGALAGGVVLGPVMGGGNLFEALFDPMTPVVTGIGAAAVLAVLTAARRRLNRVRSSPTA